MAAPISWEYRLEAIFDATGDVELAARHLEQLASAIRTPAADDREQALALAELRALTVEDNWWEDSVALASQCCAGVRLHGPLVLAPDVVWACAVRAVADLVNRVEAVVWWHGPLGEAVTQFNVAYDRMVRHAAIRSGDWTEEELGDAVPPTQRVRLYSPRPPRSVVLRATWPGGRPGPELEISGDIQRVADDLRRVWEHDRPGVDAVLGGLRELLGTVPFARLREELEWETARALTEWEYRGTTSESLLGAGQPAEPAVRPNGRLDARDQWIYQQVMETDLTYGAICRRLARVVPERGWAVIRSVEGIRQRAIRYAEMNALPLPPPRVQR